MSVKQAEFIGEVQNYIKDGGYYNSARKIFNNLSGGFLCLGRQINKSSWRRNDEENQ
ncbi:MAG: hypothetical protein GY864_06095 [Desulfobacterales bacterium]|nr:hypothetical protein [Desulfobacterales bacterium]